MEQKDTSSPAMNTTVFLLLFCAAVGSAMIADAPQDVAARREERAAVVIPCSIVNFVPLDSCGCAPVPQVSPMAALMCAGNTKRVDLFSMVRSYVINGAEVAGNKLDFSTSTIQNVYGERICYVECVFKTLNFILPDGKTLNIAAITASFLSGLTPPTSTIVQAAITKCAAKTAALVPSTITTVLGVVCQLRPAVFFQCIREQTLLNCPTKSKTVACTTLFAKLVTCDPFV